MNQCLIMNCEQYEGKYVVTKDSTSREVVSSSFNPVEAYKTAMEKGCVSPVLFYIPQHNESSFVY